MVRRRRHRDGRGRLDGILDPSGLECSPSKYADGRRHRHPWLVVRRRHPRRWRRALRLPGHGRRSGHRLGGFAERLDGADLDQPGEQHRQRPVVWRPAQGHHQRRRRAVELHVPKIRQQRHGQHRGDRGPGARCRYHDAGRCDSDHQPGKQRLHADWRQHRYRYRWRSGPDVPPGQRRGRDVCRGQRQNARRAERLQPREVRGFRQ